MFNACLPSLTTDYSRVSDVSFVFEGENYDSIHCAKLEVLTVVLLKSSLLWDVTLCCWAQLTQQHIFTSHKSEIFDLHSVDKQMW
jgi:hypothetical protein